MDDTLNRIRAVLTPTPTRWTALAATLPAELLRQPPARRKKGRRWPAFSTGWTPSEASSRPASGL